MAEKEYIERGALIAEYDRVHIGPAGRARKLMEEAPAADVVEVVRCKDCKHSYFVKSCSKYECRKGCGTLKYSNDYCSYGAKMDGGEN